MSTSNTRRAKIGSQKSTSIETAMNNVYTGRRRSLIEDARMASIDLTSMPSPTEDDVFQEFREEEGEEKTTSEKARDIGMTFGLPNGCHAASLAKTLKLFEDTGTNLLHIESRPSKTQENGHEYYIKCESKQNSFKKLLTSLKDIVKDVTLYDESRAKQRQKEHWFPKHISELDRCTHLLTQFEPDLDSEHPGFSDKEYRSRRKDITEIAFNYKYGQPVPRVDYTEDERSTWKIVYQSLKELYPNLACSQHNAVFKLLEDKGIYSEDKIPQLEDVSNFLKQRTGFQLRPVAGLLSARDFLASLAFRVFQCTQYIRHSSAPMHTPEPDCCHELLGHVPMLADPSFAQFSQEIGLASLGVSDEDITKLATLYWFSVEFGLCKQHGEIRAYGAGLLSAFGELQYALSEEPEHRPFEPCTTAVQEYQDESYQPVYFVAESFEDAKQKMREYVSTLERPFEVYYNALNQTIEVLDTKEKIQEKLKNLKADMNTLCLALTKLKLT
ncbi:tyrosine 3-monooxygenase-like isoform X2 [Ptychodera flava]|uniref:tyrosine 3-monooxygenase-like isoform X2 n=1 Tax=Ptychodera flava TaxID=63121 RepID=UPI003969DEF7